MCHRKGLWVAALVAVMALPLDAMAQRGGGRGGGGGARSGGGAAMRGGGGGGFRGVGGGAAFRGGGGAAFRGGGASSFRGGAPSFRGGSAPTFRGGSSSAFRGGSLPRSSPSFRSGSLGRTSLNFGALGRSSAAARGNIAAGAYRGGTNRSTAIPNYSRGRGAAGFAAGALNSARRGAAFDPNRAAPWASGYRGLNADGRSWDGDRGRSWDGFRGRDGRSWSGRDWDDRGHDGRHWDGRRGGWTNNWIGNRGWNLAGTRFGWGRHNNRWYNNSIWYHHHGSRWHRGFWPWWSTIGFWPGWFQPGYGYGYSPYGLAGYAYDPGIVYVNPYWDALPADQVIYDYSQPLPEAPLDEDALASIDAQAAMSLFDKARAAFQANDFEGALQQIDAALRLVNSDPSMHEFRALTLFALGRYHDAAATVYAVLSSEPGMNWETMQMLYSTPDAYTPQLRRLEAYTDAHPDEAGPQFLLAYHYMSLGHLDRAAGLLQRVVALQPDDKLSQTLFDSLEKSRTPVTEPNVPPAPTP